MVRAMLFLLLALPLALPAGVCPCQVMGLEADTDCHDQECPCVQELGQAKALTTGTPLLARGATLSGTIPIFAMEVDKASMGLPPPPEHLSEPPVYLSHCSLVI